MLTSCGEPKQCPAFSNKVFDAWFPYKQDQLLIFMNSRQEKDSIRILHYGRSAAVEIETGFFKPDCGIRADIIGGGAMELDISCQLQVGSKATYLKIDDFFVAGSAVGDTGIVLSPGSVQGYKSAYHSRLNLNGKTYPSVQLLEKDTNVIQSGILYRVYLSKENGIIAYEKYPSRELWVKQ